MNISIQSASVGEPDSASPSMPAGFERGFIIAVLAICLCKLVVYLLIIPRYQHLLWTFWSIGPADNYTTLSKYLDLGYGYRFSVDTAPTLEREPGYPLFLTLLRILFDTGYQKAAIAANVLFTSLSAFLVHSLARRAAGTRCTPALAGIIYVIYPATLGIELRIGVEAIFTFLLLCFLLLLLRAARNWKMPAFALSGFMLGVASYTRSTALLFPVFFLFLPLILKMPRRIAMRAWLGAILVFVCALGALTPWILRNERLVGRPIATASVQGVSMQVGEYVCTHVGRGVELGELDLAAAAERNNKAAAAGYRFKPDYYQMFYDAHDEVKFNDSLAAEVISDYRRSPSLFARCAAKNLLYFWFAGKTWRATILDVCMQLPFLLLAAAGIVMGGRRLDRPTLWILLLFVAYTMSVYAPIHALARYSAPLVPILATFAAIPMCKGIAAIRSRCKGRSAQGYN